MFVLAVNIRGYDHRLLLHGISPFFISFCLHIYPMFVLAVNIRGYDQGVCCMEFPQLFIFLLTYLSYARVSRKHTWVRSQALVAWNFPLFDLSVYIFTLCSC